MCGLVGVIGHVGPKVEKAFLEMLIYDSVRGPDSTGVVFVHSEASGYHTLKEAVGPHEFMDRGDFNHRLKFLNTMLMGHNRWATTGDINDKNAHPFEFDSIVGMHNGTLDNQYLLDDAHTFEVDSENIYHHMEKHGVEDTVAKLDGAFALSWYNKDDRTLNFIRNSRRPLWFVPSDDGKTIFWASEAWMAEIAMDRNGIKRKDAVNLPVGELYTFDVPKAYTTIPLPKPRSKKLKFYTPPERYDTAWYDSFGGSSGGNKVKKPSDNPLSGRYKGLVGCHTSFEVVGTGQISGMDYINCRHAVWPDINIRVFCSKRIDVWEKMLNSCNTFSGRIKSYNDKSSYLTVDLRTLKENNPIDDVEEALEDNVIQTAQGWRGELLDESKYEKLTQEGCAWCASHTAFEEAHKIHWISSQEHICDGCRDVPDVQQYINLGV